MAMKASVKFDQIVKRVQDSHLNFRLELFPFSTNISLRKSFIRDKWELQSFEYFPATGKFEIDDKDDTIKT